MQAFVDKAASEGERRWEAIVGTDSLRSWLARRGLLAGGLLAGENSSRTRMLAA